MLRGFDVSSHEVVIPALSTYDFAMLRSSYGTEPDSRYFGHLATARAAGLPVIAWHFGRHGGVANQLTTMLRVAPDADGYALDLEADGSNPPMTRQEARDFIARGQSTGRKFGLYDNESGYPDLGQDWRWVAYWKNNPPPIKWDIWQESRNGAPIRQDGYDGTVAELKGTIGMLPLIVADDTPHAITIPSGTPVYDLGGARVKVTSAVNDRNSGFLVTIGQGIGNYWMVKLAVDGHPTVSLVRKNTVTDNGPVPSGGTDPAAIEAARAAGFADAKSKALAAVQLI